MMIWHAARGVAHLGLGAGTEYSFAEAGRL
jgi:hypothetical protein